MLFIQDQLIKLGGVMLSGQVKSIDISQAATIEEIQDDKGKTKASQPTGYEAAKVSVDFILEDSDKSVLEQLADLQRLFKPYGQTAAQLLTIVNEDCAARGITEVYFKSLSTKNVISSSGRTATLELLTPVLAGVQTKTTASEGASSGGKKNSTKKASNTKSTKDESKSPTNEPRRVGRSNMWEMRY